jgi:DNA (cytosine-5)-methyltransferase 1
MLENVPEFREWGPLTKRGQPDKRRKGQTFRLWCDQLRSLGYELQSRELKACDFGAPTIRKRLFVVARCDGQAIVWPQPTHGPGRIAYRTAAECIDWSLPCPSIFLSPEEAKEWGVRRPLKPKTMERIARGIRKFVLESGNPFIIKFRQGATGQTLAEPMHAITAGSYIKRPAGAGHAMGLVVPVLDNLTHGGRTEPIEEPLRTITTANRGEKALIAASLVNYHGAKGQEARGQAVDEPLRTQDTQNRFGVAAATLIQTGYGERQGQAPRVPGLDKPLGTVVGTQKHAVVSAFVQKYFGDSVGSAADKPASTVLERNHDALVTASLMTNTTGHSGAAMDEPVPTVTTGNHHYFVASYLTKLYGTTTSSDVREPIPTVTGGGQHIGEVRAFLLKYYGTAVGQDCRTPLHTVTAKHRLGLVMVAGEEYQIADIGLRMLTPRELARPRGSPTSTS